MRCLKALGVWIALDDFGTAIPALSYLRDFAWDELKVDRSFVQTLESDAQSLLIIRSIVELAQRLNISVTVEGSRRPASARCCVGPVAGSPRVLLRPCGAGRRTCRPVAAEFCACAVAGKAGPARKGRLRQGRTRAGPCSGAVCCCWRKLITKTPLPHPAASRPRAGS
ncbi:MAG: EAL domain-containing protein [Alphaproteobacteria bacterium]|nr:EAL domain-containing protein [Alphaproteobacteria bacterium]